MTTELRHLPIQGLRTREATNEAGEVEGIVEGYSAIYNEQYRVFAGLTESIATNAFAKSISERNAIIPIFWAHGWQKNNDTPIGHAVVREDAKGLHTTAHLYVDTEPRIRALFNAVQAGAIREWSVGFIPTEIALTRDAHEGTENEEIVEGNLIEASLAVKGMNPGTFITNTRSDELEAETDAAAAKVTAPAADAEPGGETAPPAGTEPATAGGEPVEGATSEPNPGDAADADAPKNDENAPAAGGEGTDAPAADAEDAEARERTFAALSNPALRSELRAQIEAGSE